MATMAASLRLNVSGGIDSIPAENNSISSDHTAAPRKRNDRRAGLCARIRARFESGSTCRNSTVYADHLTRELGRVWA
jgi:hypothetical protein